MTPRPAPASGRSALPPSCSQPLPDPSPPSSPPGSCLIDRPHHASRCPRRCPYRRVCGPGCPAHRRRPARRAAPLDRPAVALDGVRPPHNATRRAGVVPPAARQGTRGHISVVPRWDHSPVVVGPSGDHAPVFVGPSEPFSWDHAWSWDQGARGPPSGPRRGTTSRCGKAAPRVATGHGVRGPPPRARPIVDRAGGAAPRRRRPVHRVLRRHGRRHRPHDPRAVLSGRPSPCACRARSQGQTRVVRWRWR